MNDDLMNVEVVSLMVVMALIIESLDVGKPGVKHAIAETLREAVERLPDQGGIKVTLERFHKVLERGPLDSLLH